MAVYHKNSGSIPNSGNFLRNFLWGLERLWYNEMPTLLSIDKKILVILYNSFYQLTWYVCRYFLHISLELRCQTSIYILGLSTHETEWYADMFYWDKRYLTMVLVELLIILTPPSLVKTFIFFSISYLSSRMRIFFYFPLIKAFS